MEKIVTKARMMILMSKLIKSVSKHMRDKHEAVISFYVKSNEKIRWFDIGGDILIVNEDISFEEFRSLVEKALKETGCNGIIFGKGGAVHVKVFGKPTKPFKMLQRLIYKYSGITIEWDTIRNETIDEPQSVEYLCFDEERCQDVIDFIRENRTAKDKMSVDIITDREEGYINISMILRVATPRGKLKAEATFFK